jgi:hypothetical protein
MIFIKKGWRKYPVINTPVTKLFLVDLLEKYPKGFFINDGKKLHFTKGEVDYKKFNVRIDFLNTLKIFGLIGSLYYFFSFKNKAKKVLKGNGEATEDFMKNLRKKYDFDKDIEEE